MSSIQTPAKLNLGLEIIGRRSDGYHEIRTIFQAVTIYDTLTFAPASNFRYTSADSIPAGDDIARPIIERAARRYRWTGRLCFEKAIPVAAGLGGGSSNAALALRLEAAAGCVHPDPVDARAIGADVPFFLKGGTALASGVGDVLTLLPTPELWFVVHIPPVAIAEKTRTLFSGLIAADFSDGSKVAGIGTCLATGEALPHVLPNAFERQMLKLEPVSMAWKALQSAGGTVALSGAGPAVFSWHETEQQAQDVSTKVAPGLPGTTLLCRSLPAHRDEQDVSSFARLLAARSGSTG